MTPGSRNPTTVAIVFFTHVFDAATVANLEKLREESASYGTFFVYSDIRGANPGEALGEVVRFDFDVIRREYPKVLGETLIPGNSHMAFLDFYQRHPGFQYYWLIEYDVMLTGRWQDFFHAFTDQRADFLAAHLRLQKEEPDWTWWHTLTAPNGQVLPATLVRAFCPIQRMSRRALELVEARSKEGWGGHFECLVPTLLLDGGCTLADIGGDGPFVPKGFRNRFYRSFSWRDGTLLFFGTMRFRPEFSRWRLSRRRAIYHPVKPPAGKARPTGVRAARNLQDRLGYVLRHLANHPLSFSRALLRYFLPSRG
jgi:hypothetical protein